MKVQIEFRYANEVLTNKGGMAPNKKNTQKYIQIYVQIHILRQSYIQMVQLDYVVTIIMRLQTLEMLEKIVF